MNVTIREDEGEFTVTLEARNEEFEGRGETLAEAFIMLAESLEGSGL